MKKLNIQKIKDYIESQGPDTKIYIGAGTLKYLPMSFYLPHYLQALSFGVTTTIAAGYFPARKASKVDPVTIIRG
jgi:lipoprotein-releasing system permease protein